VKVRVWVLDGGHRLARTKDLDVDGALPGRLSYLLARMGSVVLEPSGGALRVYTFNLLGKLSYIDDLSPGDLPEPLRELLPGEDGYLILEPLG